MFNLKQEIPNLASLEKRLGEVFEQNTSGLIEKTNARRVTVVENERLSKIAVIATLLSFVSFAFANTFFQPPFNLLFFALIIFLGIVTAVFVFRLNREQKIFAQELNTLLIPALEACLNQTIKYAKETEHNRETYNILRESKLISNYDSVRTDDMYTFTEPYPLTAREIFVTRQEGSGKNSHTVTVFHGILVRVELSKNLAGVTYISTEGDKYGFGHQNFWTGLDETEGVRETLLEWNEFERDLHVASNDGAEARYILTPDFMVDLHNWWLENKQNIRIVFRGSEMLMLLPDVNIRISTSTTSTDSQKLKEYALTILKPLWRTLTLVEDIKL